MSFFDELKKFGSDLLDPAGVLFNKDPVIDLGEQGTQIARALGLAIAAYLTAGAAGAAAPGATTAGASAPGAVPASGGITAGVDAGAMIGNGASSQAISQSGVNLAGQGAQVGLQQGAQQGVMANALKELGKGAVMATGATALGGAGGGDVPDQIPRSQFRAAQPSGIPMGGSQVYNSSQRTTLGGTIATTPQGVEGDAGTAQRATALGGKVVPQVGSRRTLG